jgi:diketogulonate reductase-like aldo/keto reductase
MRAHKFGRTNVEVPVIGQGTWKIDGGEREASIQALQRGIDLGMRHVDTAELYGRGRAEDVVAEAIRGRRDEVFLVSKVMPGNASKKGTIAACERSLRHLQTDFLDCYLLHWPGEHPLEETIAAFDSLESSGKIRAWGVSNFDVDELEEAESIAGPNRIACNQVLYHLEERAIEERVLPWCEAHNVAVVGYCPFAEGTFVSPKSNGGQVLARIAAKHEATTRQVALAYLTRTPHLFTIPKSSSVPHTEDNARAGRVELDHKDELALDHAFPMRKRKLLPTV